MVRLQVFFVLSLLNIAVAGAAPKFKLTHFQAYGGQEVTTSAYEGTVTGVQVVNQKADAWILEGNSRQRYSARHNFVTSEAFAVGTNLRIIHGEHRSMGFGFNFYEQGSKLVKVPHPAWGNLRLTGGNGGNHLFGYAAREVSGEATTAAAIHNITTGQTEVFQLLKHTWVAGGNSKGEFVIGTSQFDFQQASTTEVFLSRGTSLERLTFDQAFLPTSMNEAGTIGAVAPSGRAFLWRRETGWLGLPWIPNSEWDAGRVYISQSGFVMQLAGTSPYVFEGDKSYALTDQIVEGMYDKSVFRLDFRRAGSDDRLDLRNPHQPHEQPRPKARQDRRRPRAGDAGCVGARPRRADASKAQGIARSCGEWWGIENLDQDGFLASFGVGVLDVQQVDLLRRLAP